jgi:hypothetical protein
LRNVKTEYSNIVSLAVLRDLIRQTPTRTRVGEWRRRHVLSTDGSNMDALLDSGKGFQASILLIQTTQNTILGCYTLPAWGSDTPTLQYFGDRECFVFSIDIGFPMFFRTAAHLTSGLPLETAVMDGIHIYRATNHNQFHMFRRSDGKDAGLSIGGGSHAAIHVDSRMSSGTSGPCETYDSPVLGHDSGSFSIQEAELWTYAPVEL